MVRRGITSEEVDYSQINFINDQERIYFAEAHLGEQARDFLLSPVGRYLHGRAKQVVDLGKDTLALIEDPTTPEGVKLWKKTKQEMANAECFITWLAEAMVNGDNAAKQLEEYRQ